MRTRSDMDAAKRKVIGAYANAIVRLYCTIRFRIMNMRILEEIGQYLPRGGRVLDVGCGFGLFSLFYALTGPDRRFVSLDLDEKRIGMAREAAAKIGVADRIDFQCRRAESLATSGDAGTFDAIYLLDLIHHVPPAHHDELIGRVHELLAPGGIALVKEIETRPAYKVWFTWVLDILMAPKLPPHYQSPETMIGKLEAVGFEVRKHSMLDVLPYPHVLYVCRKA